MKVIVIGGVAGGVGVATRIKRLQENAEVIVLEKGEYPSFANCGLPYHISRTIVNRSQLLVHTPESLKKRSDIEVRTSHEVLQIIPTEKIVKVIDLKENATYEETYDFLVIATGSLPMKPPISGIESPKVASLHTIPDMDHVISLLQGEQKHIAVIGGGFIGLEATENLVKLGHTVSLIERNEHVMANLDAEMSAYIEDELIKNGVKLYLNKGLNKIDEHASGLSLYIDDEIIDVDFVIMSTGVIPNSKLAKEAGLKLNERQAIIVNEYLQTSDPSIYAVGDVIETYNLATHSRMTIPLAGPATRQARICAENICGGQKKYIGINPTAICKVFDLVIASTGATEKQLQSHEYQKVYVHPFNHPTYYPNAHQMHIKMLYNQDGTVLGAQIVGGDGVDKRIDIFAISVRQQLSVYDLAEQDFAYAPPFGSPRDPIHVAVFTAINQLEELTHIIYDINDKKNALLLDVREDVEIKNLPISSTHHIPLGMLRTRYQELDKSRDIVIVCASGLRAYLAERFLRQQGYNAYNYSGGQLCLSKKK